MIGRADDGDDYQRAVHGPLLLMMKARTQREEALAETSGSNDPGNLYSPPCSLKTK
jgi:hypothetical protein